MLKKLIDPITSALKTFIPDANKRADLAHEIATMAEKHAHENALEQIELNKIEASSASIFKSGWRPFIGWICATGFLYHILMQPFMIFVLVAIGQPLPVLPEFDMASMMTMLAGMLGLGGLRSFEKFKGISR